MQRHSPVYNWFSRATSCCHSLSNEPLAGALLLVNHRMSDVAAIHHPTPTGMAPGWSTDITRLLFSFKILPSFFLKVFWVGEASQTSRGKLLSSPAADWRLALFTWTTGIFRPYGCQCLCLRSRVSLWASKAKPLIGHGSSITQSNPFHPKSHPNSYEEWDPRNGLYASQRPKSRLREGQVVCVKTTLIPSWCQAMYTSVLSLSWHA